MHSCSTRILLLLLIWSLAQSEISARQINDRIIFQDDEFLPRQIRQSDDRIVFDDELPEDVNINQIAVQPVRYSPFTYNLKYFSELPADSSYSYDYNSPRSPRIWARSFPSCGGAHQSPINLITDTCVRVSMKPLQNSQLDLDPQSVIMENNGHSIEFTFEYAGPRPMLTGGPLKSTYIFEQLHFHWGADKDQGSEHYIDSVAGELEMHIVHRNARYGNMSQAAQNPDGIVVLGVLFKTSAQAPDREFLQNIFQVQRMRTSATLRNFPQGFRMRDVVGDFAQPFIGYQGSLTTPPCHESVSWLVAQKMQEMSPRDMASFRRVLVESGRSMAPNYRPLQDWNKRKCMIF